MKLHERSPDDWDSRRQWPVSYAAKQLDAKEKKFASRAKLSGKKLIAGGSFSRRTRLVTLANL
jgi:hypothetical protein